MTASAYKRIGIASAIMMASVFLSRAAGLLREMVIAYMGGARGEVDAYQIAFIIPEILNHILASGFLSVTFIPIFSKHLVRGEEEAGWDVFLMILNTFGAVMLLLSGAAVILSPVLIATLAPGLTDPALKDSAVRMTRIIIPAQFFFFAGGLFSAVQFAKDQFAVPALAPLLYNTGIIAGGVLLGPRMGMEGFAWGALAGAGVGNFILQCWGAKRAGMKYRVKFGLLHPEIRRYILLTLPLMIGLTMTFSTELFFKFFGSFLPRGGIAGLNYSIRVMFVLVGIFGQAVGVASFPVLSQLAADKKIFDMNRILNQTLRMLSLVIPLSVLMMVLRREVVFLLFQRGRFDAAATEMTSGILVYILIGAFAFSAQTIVVRGFYALQNTMLPAVYQTAAVLISIPIYLVGMHTMGVYGVAMGVSLSAMIQSLWLFHIWSRLSRNRGEGAVIRFVVKMALISISVGVVFEGVRRAVIQLPGAETVAGALAVSALIGGTFLGTLFLLGSALKISEVRLLRDRIVGSIAEKVARRRGR